MRCAEEIGRVEWLDWCATPAQWGSVVQRMSWEYTRDAARRWAHDAMPGRCDQHEIVVVQCLRGYQTGRSNKAKCQCGAETPRRDKIVSRDFDQRGLV